MPPTEYDSLSRFSKTAPAQWHSQTETNLAMALRAHKLADEQFVSSALGHTYTWDDNVSQYQGVHQNFAKKVSTTRQLRDLLDERIRSLSRTIDDTRQTLSSLQAACAAKDEPMSLCQWRMEQRASRPERELVRDQFEISLEKERDALHMAQEKLKNQTKKTENAVQTLQLWKDELADDYQHKVESLKIDEQCMTTAHRTWPAKGKPRMDRTLLAAGADVTGGGGGGRGMKMPSLPADDPSHSIASVRNANDEEKRQTETMQRIAQARETERSASGLREENARCIAKTNKDCSTAKRHVEEAMTRRIEETQSMKKRLEWTIEETERKIQMISESMSKTGANLRSHDEPEAICSSREKFRNGRSHRENIGDPVTTSMDKHKYRLRRNQKHLEQCHIDEEGTIRTLEDAKRDLMSDLSDKVKALTIDLRCQNWATQHPAPKAAQVPQGPAFAALQAKVKAL